MTKIDILSTGYNYILQKGYPYKSNNNGWTNYDRIVAASRVLNGESHHKVADDIGCCVQTIKNWIKTLDTNNPRLSDKDSSPWVSNI